eukprot:TRINITY_DN18763_c0_g1_i4.p1 TRINITY_DN18763_c0_g1~~TRINITY_DN18763_c0_g1_i4.p1  ORF type:complete len:404 (-),score=70.47 TRINITY_DN18763_c0_g1_i4:636-1847(-)
MPQMSTARAPATLPQQQFQQPPSSAAGGVAQPSWVYFVPMPPTGAPMTASDNRWAAAGCPTSPAQGVNLTPIAEALPSRGESTAASSEAESGDAEATAVSASLQQPPQHQQRLSASALRRRRRLRAAAFAKAEKLQMQQQGKFVAPGGSVSVSQGGRETKANCLSVVNITAEMCRTLMEQLKAGGEHSQRAIAKLRGSVRRFAFDSQGCRVLQAAIERGSQPDVAQLLSELHGSVQRAIASPHGNYVIQKTIEVMPPALTHFITEELRHRAVETARHRYGCRVLCRLLEHSSTDRRTVDLLGELLKTEAGQLCRHEFAHHVMECIVEHGVPSQKAQVIAALENEMAINIHDRSALYTLGSALHHCPHEERKRLSAALQRQSDARSLLAEHPSGMYILNTLGIH